MSGSVEKKQVTRIWRLKLERRNNLSFDTNKSSFLLHSMSPNLWHCILPLVCLIVCSHTQSHQANSWKSPCLRQCQLLFFYQRERDVVEKAIGNSTLTEGPFCVFVCAFPHTHVVAKATSRPPHPPQFSRGNQRFERLLSSSASLHLLLSQWHKFLPLFPRLPGADETLNGGLMKSQGLSCGLITQAPLMWCGPPLFSSMLEAKEYSH